MNVFVVGVRIFTAEHNWASLIHKAFARAGSHMPGTALRMGGGRGNIKISLKISTSFFKVLWAQNFTRKRGTKSLTVF